MIFSSVVGATMFLFLMRKGKNILADIIFNKKYVVCHLKNENTGFVEIWKVVPPTDKMTKVGNHYYNLNPNYALLSWKNRLHFQLNRGDVIPRYFERTNSKEEILIQVDEIDTAINTKAYKIIYGKEKNITLLICAAALLLALVTAIYAIYTIDKINATMTIIYAKAMIIEAAKNTGT